MEAELKILIVQPDGKSIETDFYPENAVNVLLELIARNRLRNDNDAYQHKLAEWGLGIEAERPTPADFGVSEWK